MPEQHSLSSKEKAALRSASQRLKPSARVGKGGLSDTVIAEIEKAFRDDELIKLAFKESRKELEALAAQIESRLSCICVGGVGRRRSFYRPMVAKGDEQ